MVGREEGSGREIGKAKQQVRKRSVFQGRREKLLFSPSLYPFYEHGASRNLALY
jgi:hypothetical protein